MSTAIVLASDLIQAEPGLLIWTTVTFLLVVIFLGWKVWGPLMKIIDEREKSIQDSVDQARLEREQAEKLLEEQKKAAGEARAEAAEMVRKNRAEVDAAKVELMEKAKSEAEQLVIAARHTIEEEKRKALAEVRSAAVDLALAAASNIVKLGMDDQTQRTLAQEFIASIEQEPAAQQKIA